MLSHVLEVKTGDKIHTPFGLRTVHTLDEIQPMTRNVLDLSPNSLPLHFRVYHFVAMLNIDFRTRLDKKICHWNSSFQAHVEVKRLA